MTGNPPGYDSIWVVGDDFVSDMFGQLQQEDNIKPYIMENYTVKIFNSNSLSMNPSTTARIHNLLIDAMKKYTVLPKAIIVVFDADVIKTITLILGYPKFLVV